MYTVPELNSEKIEIFLNFIMKGHLCFTLCRTQHFGPAQQDQQGSGQHVPALQTQPGFAPPPPVQILQQTVQTGQQDVSATQVQATFAQQPTAQVQQHVIQPAPAVPQAVQPPGQQQQSTPQMVTVAAPPNPVLQSSLYNAMMQQGGDSGLTMDDLGNAMLTQGRTIIRYRGPNASEEFQRHLSYC